MTEQSKLEREILEKLVLHKDTTKQSIEGKNVLAFAITQHILDTLPKVKKCLCSDELKGRKFCICGVTDFNSCLSTIKKGWGVNNG